MDSKHIQALVEEWQGVVLEDAAAERLAGISVSVRAALDTVAGNSMFDTEPAHFERVLNAMARHD